MKKSSPVGYPLSFLFFIIFLAEPGHAANHEDGGVRICHVLVAHIEAVNCLAHVGLGQVGSLLAALHGHYLVVAQHLWSLGGRRLVKAVLEAWHVDALSLGPGRLEGVALVPDGLIVILVLLLARLWLGCRHAAPTAAGWRGIGAHNRHLVGAATHARVLNTLASHLLVKPADGDVRQRRRAARNDLAPEAKVVGDRLLTGEDDCLLALAVAAGAAKEALEVGVVLPAHAVIEHADVGVGHGL